MPRAGTAAFLPPAQFVHAPEALGRAWSQPDARAYTRWLATRHYENFHVVSFLLPKRLHQDFYNVYAYCRWADDLGDEIGDREESLRLLAWWSGELDGMYQGRATHPVFVALEETVRRHQIPRRPFADLILAFVQDQNVTRYAPGLRGARGDSPPPPDSAAAVRRLDPGVRAGPERDALCTRSSWRSRRQSAATRFRGGRSPT